MPKNNNSTGNPETNWPTGAALDDLVKKHIRQHGSDAFKIDAAMVHELRVMAERELLSYVPAVIDTVISSFCRILLEVEIDQAERGAA